MPDEPVTPEAALHAKLRQAAAENLPGVVVDADGWTRMMCDGEAFYALPDCTACAGCGKDTHDTEFDETTVHIPGPPITVSGRRRQLCAWCGHVLDDLVLSRVGVEAGDPTVPVFPDGQLVRFDRGVAYALPYTAGDPLPDDCCAVRAAEPVEETSRG